MPGRADRIPSPQIDGQLCVHALLPAATCRACVDACPRQALVLDGEGLGIDESRCDACGLCRPACPQTAIELPFNPLFRRSREGTLGVLAACEKTGHEGAGLVACVHALTTGDINDRFAPNGGVELALFAGDCETCPRGSAPSAGDLLAALNAWRLSRCLAPAAGGLVDEGGWRRALARFVAPPDEVDRGRRQLFSLFTTNRQQQSRPAGQGGGGAAAAPADAERLYYHRPQIDPQRCSGCDACVNICPHQCLRLERAETTLAFAIDPEPCTGCGLCVDVCDEEAVIIEPLGLARQRRLALVDARCERCGAPFHLPDAQMKDGAVCPVCRTRDHTARLFQVFD